MKYLILIIVVLLSFAPIYGLLLPKSSVSSEANETISNSTKATIDPSEAAVLEQRLADVL